MSHARASRLHKNALLGFAEYGSRSVETCITEVMDPTTAVTGHEKCLLWLTLAEHKYRCNEITAARELYKQVIACHPPEIIDKADTAVVGRAFLGLGSIEAEYGNINEAVRCFHRASKMLTLAGANRLAQLARFNLAMALDQRGKVKKAFEMLRELEKEALKENNKILRVMVLVSIGTMEVRKGNIQMGWRYLLKAKNLSILSGNVHFIILVLSNLVDVAVTLKRYHLAEYFAYYLQLFGLQVNMNNPSMLLVLTRLHRTTGNVNLAQEYLDKAHEFLQHLPASREWIWFYLETAQLILEDHQLIQEPLKSRRLRAYSYLKLAAELARKWGSWKDLSIVLLEIARVQLEESDVENSLVSIREVLALSRRSGFLVLQLNALLVEASILALLGSFSGANMNIQQARSIAEKNGLIDFLSDIEDVENLVKQEELSHQLYQSCVEQSDVVASEASIEMVQDYIQQAKTLMLYYQGS